MSRNKGRHNKSIAIKANINQALTPPNFRISRSLPGTTQIDLLEIQEQIETIKRAFLNQSVTVDTASKDAIQSLQKAYSQQLGLIVDLCTGLWRIQQNFASISEAEIPDKIRRAQRHLNSMLDNLTQSGFIIQDHTNTPYDDGLNLNVAAYDQTPGLTRSFVIETIKPSIYFKDKLVRSGEVIVGIPQKQD